MSVLAADVAGNDKQNGESAEPSMRARCGEPPCIPVVIEPVEGA